MDIEQAQKEFLAAENELLHIRRKYRNDPENLKVHEPMAVFNMKVAEAKLQILKGQRSESG
ncbi:hypothetical protein [Lentibacillus salinarum]|uniref:Uncharacterized protein n=1 Tax=Lentibacillus salinarum TaxID=446820 RepID=A0ABW3ZWX0_9BACI